MADIRIKDLAVTAGSSASDDYLAVDGSTNGTRKLSAYSPTFGGNLTVSGGTATVSGSSGYLKLTSTTASKTWDLFADNGGPFIIAHSGVVNAVQINPTTGNTYVTGQLRSSSNIVASNLGSANTGFYGTAGTDAGSGHRLALVRTDTPTGGSALLSSFGAAVIEVNAATGINTGTVALTLDTSGNATFAGNISAIGTGLSAISGSLNVAGIGTFNKSLDNITTESDYAIRIKTSADDGGLYLGANSTISAIQAIDPGTTFGRNLAIQSQGGNVLIGTTSNTGQKLQVNGTAYVSGDATFAGTVTATQFKSATGSVSATNSNATTLFSLSGISGQLLMVHVYINVGDAANYAAYATIVMDGSAARIVSNNASLMTITLSGANVQATQNSGVTQSIIWKYTSV